MQQTIKAVNIANKNSFKEVLGLYFEENLSIANNMYE